MAGQQLYPYGWESETNPQHSSGDCHCNLASESIWAARLLDECSDLAFRLSNKKFNSQECNNL